MVKVYIFNKSNKLNVLRVDISKDICEANVDISAQCTQTSGRIYYAEMGLLQLTPCNSCYEPVLLLLLLVNKRRR